LEHPEEVGFVELSARDQAPEVVKPGEESLDFPAAQFAPILSLIAAVGAIRRDQRIRYSRHSLRSNGLLS